MKFAILLSAVLTFTTAQATQHAIPSSQFLRRVPIASLGQTSDALFYDVDSTALAKELGSGGQIQITNFPGGYSDPVTLDLKPAHSPIDSKTEFWIGSVSGAKRIAVPPFAAFRGKVLGEPNSRVFLTTFAGKLLVSITRESGETYVFGPAKNDENFERHIFTLESDLFSYGEFHPMNCTAENISQPSAPVPVAELLQKYRSNAMSPLGDTTHSRLL